MESKNYAEVLIDGKIYTLGGSEEEGYLLKVASYINEKISSLRKQPGFLKQSADYQMVMTELNMADDYFKEKKRADDMEEHQNIMNKDIYSLKHELVSTQMKLEVSNQELENIRKQLEEAWKEAQSLKNQLSQEKRQREALEEQSAAVQQSAAAVQQPAPKKWDDKLEREKAIQQALQAGSKGYLHQK